MAKADQLRDDKNARLLKSVREGIDSLLLHPIPSEAGRLVSVIVLQGVEGTSTRGAIETQLGRSLNSVGANFMEGLGMTDTQQVIRFLKISRGSAYESVFHATCLGRYVPETRNLALLIDDYLAAFLIGLVGIPLAQDLAG